MNVWEENLLLTFKFTDRHGISTFLTFKHFNSIKGIQIIYTFTDLQNMTKYFLDFPDTEWGTKKIGSILYHTTYG